MGYGEDSIPAVPYDAVVEWLESTGTQWIDSGILPASDLDVSIAFRLTSAFVAYTGIFGSYLNTNHNTAVAIRTRATLVDGFNVVYNVATSVAVSGDVSVTMRRGAFSVNGVDYTQTPSGTSYGTTTMSIFNTALAEEHTLAGNSAGARIYSLTIRKSGVLVRDFIPVRVGTVGYLYDRSNPTGGPIGNGLYPNSGSGAFVIGPDVA